MNTQPKTAALNKHDFERHRRHHSRTHEGRHRLEHVDCSSGFVRGNSASCCVRILASSGRIYNLAVDKNRDIRCVAEHTGLVHRIAGAMRRRMPQSVDYDDLVQDGMIGLLHAARNFVYDGRAKFETYATTRIYGAIVDGLRATDSRTRHLGRAMRRMDEATVQLEHELGRSPSDSEVATRIGFRLGEYQALIRDAEAHGVVSYDQFGTDEYDPGADRFVSGERGPEERAEERQRERAVIEAFAALTEHERVVMDLYYARGMTFKEIARHLGVDPSRITQVHATCLEKLRIRFARTYAG